MKKLFLLSIAIVCTLSISACSNEEQPSSPMIDNVDVIYNNPYTNHDGPEFCSYTKKQISNNGKIVSIPTNCIFEIKDILDTNNRIEEISEVMDPEDPNVIDNVLNEVDQNIQKEIIE